MSRRDWRDSDRATARYGSSTGPVEFEEATVIRESDSGLALQIARYGKRFWVPKSVIHEDSQLTSRSGPGDEGTLCLKRWFCEKEGLEP